MKYPLVISILLLSINNCLAQRAFTEVVQFKGKFYPTLVLNTPNIDRSSIDKNIDKLIITPIENSPADFEIRLYNTPYSIGASNRIIVFKIIKDSCIGELYNSIQSKNRNATQYPDSLGKTITNEIIQRRIVSSIFSELEGKKILTSFWNTYVTAMADQTKYIDSLKNNKVHVQYPCIDTKDCSDFFNYYELKVNKRVRKFNRVGLDYYKLNPQLHDLKDNPTLSKIFFEIFDIIFSNKLNSNNDNQ